MPVKTESHKKYRQGTNYVRTEDWKLETLKGLQQLRKREIERDTEAEKEKVDFGAFF